MMTTRRLASVLVLTVITVQVLGCSDRVLVDLDLDRALWDEIERAQRNRRF